MILAQPPGVLRLSHPMLGQMCAHGFVAPLKALVLSGYADCPRISLTHFGHQMVGTRVVRSMAKPLERERARRFWFCGLGEQVA